MISISGSLSKTFLNGDAHLVTSGLEGLGKNDCQRRGIYLLGWTVARKRVQTPFRGIRSFVRYLTIATPFM